MGSCPERVISKNVTSGYLAWRSALKGMHWHMADMLVTTVHPDLIKANCPYQCGGGPEHAL